MNSQATITIVIYLVGKTSNLILLRATWSGCMWQNANVFFLCFLKTIIHATVWYDVDVIDCIIPWLYHNIETRDAELCLVCQLGVSFKKPLIKQSRCWWFCSAKWNVMHTCKWLLQRRINKNKNILLRRMYIANLMLIVVHLTCTLKIMPFCHNDWFRYIVIIFILNFKLRCLIDVKYISLHGAMDVLVTWHIMTKWLPFLRRHFQRHFR